MAAASWEWSINGTAYATTETFTVPATAREGDAITVTVTSENEETATDTVYVVEDLALISVEAADLDQRKVLIAYFSEPVGDLQPGDIQIRRVADNKLSTVENVIMSSDKMTATLQLVGYSSQNVQGLAANVEYNMIVSTSEGTASKIFTIPGVVAEAVVTTVDSSKNQIELWNGFYNYGLFTVGEDLEVDYNEILGRTVTVQYDKNNVIQEFTLLEEPVIYGAFKLDDKDIKAKVTDTKYPLSFSSVGSIYETVENNLDGEGALIGGNDVAYAKVVLNGNGTVRSITSITDFENVVYVAGVSGTDLLNVKGTATTLKDYNIFKDGKTITIDDIEAGDVVFIDTTKKNAEVYNDSVEGKMTVYTDKIEVNGTRYDTKGDLVADGKDVQATNANLKNYNGSNVEVFFARTGDVAKIVVTDAIVNSSNKFVVLTDNAKLSVSGSTQTLEFKAGDGAEVKNYSIDLSKLESVIATDGSYAIKGKPAKVGGNTSTNNVTAVGIAATTYDAATLDGDIIAKDKNGELDGTTGTDAPNDFTLFTVSTALPKGTLVGLTTKEDGTITGLALAEGPNAAGTVAHADVALNAYTDIFDDATGKTFKGGYSKIGDGTSASGEDGVLLPSTTPVLVYYPDSKDVKLYEYGDVDFTFTVDNNNDGLVRYSGAKAAAIMIDAKNAGIAAADVNKKHAVIVSATFDQSATKKLVDLTVAYETNAKVVYKELANEIPETSLTAAGTTTNADWKPGTYVEIEETKTDGKLAKVTAKAKDATLANYTGQDKSEFVLNNTYKMITADDAGVPTTIVTLSSDGKTVKTLSWSEYCDYDKTKVASVDIWEYATGYADVVLVKLAGAAGGATSPLAPNAGTAVQGTDGWTVSTATTTLTGDLTWLPTGVAADSFAWYKKASADAAAVKIAGAATDTLTLPSHNAGEIFYLVVTGDDGEKYPSAMVTLAAPVATSITATTATAVTVAAGENAFANVTVADQFGVAMAAADDDGLAASGSTLAGTGLIWTKAGWNATGKLTVTTTNASAALTASATDTIQLLGTTLSIATDAVKDVSITTN